MQEVVLHGFSNWSVGFSVTGQLAFQELELATADNPRTFVFLIAFEDGTADISFSDPIFIHLHSLFQEKDETRNLGCNC